MKKRLLAIIAAFVLAFSCAFFVACEDETVTPGTPGNEQDSDQGGSTGGDQGGSTGGDQGGSTGGDQGGSTGGDQGGSTGGDQGGGDVTAYTYAVYAVSENTYTTPEAAIRGYIANELAGTVEIRSDVVFGFGKTPYDNKTADQTEGIATNSITATYGSHESKGAATLGDFGFTVAQKTGLLSLEKFTANVTLAFFEEFDRGDGSVAVERVTSYPQNITQTIYVAKYGDTQYKYIVATPEQGERLTNTYMKAIASFTNYANCKVQVQSEFLTSMDAIDGEFSSGEILEITEQYGHWMMYDTEDAFHNRGQCAEEEYYVQTDSECPCVVRNSTGWWVSDDNCDVLEECVNGSLMATWYLGGALQYPAAMHVATVDGFRFELQEYEPYTRHCKMDVTVTDGKITSYLSVYDDGDGDCGRYRITIGDFGTTVIVPPNEVLEAVQNSRA